MNTTREAIGPKVFLRKPIATSDFPGVCVWGGGGGEGGPQNLK